MSGFCSIEIAQTAHLQIFETIQSFVAWAQCGTDGVELGKSSGLFYQKIRRQLNLIAV